MESSVRKHPLPLIVHCTLCSALRWLSASSNRFSGVDGILSIHAFPARTGTNRRRSGSENLRCQSIRPIALTSSRRRSSTTCGHQNRTFRFPAMRMKLSFRLRRIQSRLAIVVSSLAATSSELRKTGSGMCVAGVSLFIAVNLHDLCTSVQFHSSVRRRGRENIPAVLPCVDALHRHVRPAKRRGKAHGQVPPALRANSRSRHRNAASFG